MALKLLLMIAFALYMVFSKSPLLQISCCVVGYFVICGVIFVFNHAAHKADGEIEDWRDTFRRIV